MSKYVYLIRNEETGNYKIGVSVNPRKRIKQLQTGSGEELQLIESFRSRYPRRIENALHQKYRHLRRSGEWFYLSIEDEVSFIDYCEMIEKNIKKLKEMGNEFL